MRKARGFTLIELLVVIGIVGILLGLALPSYLDSVRKGRRADAQANLRAFEVCAARYFTVNSSFTAGDGIDTACNPDPDDADDYYTYSHPAATTSLTYTIQAAPKGAQADDKCGTMTLNQTGQTTAAASDCW